MEEYSAISTTSCGLLRFDIKRLNQSSVNGTYTDNYDILIRDGKMREEFAALFVFNQPMDSLNLTIIGDVCLKKMFFHKK